MNGSLEVHFFYPCKDTCTGEFCASRQSPSRPYVRPLVSPVWKKKGGVGAPPVISHTNSVDSFGNSAGWSGVDSCRCVQRRQHGGGDDAVARRPGGGGEGSCAPPTGSADSYACRRGAAIRCFSAPQKPDPVLCFRACAAVPVDAPPPPPPRARSAQRAVQFVQVPSSSFRYLTLFVTTSAVHCHSMTLYLSLTCVAY